MPSLPTDAQSLDARKQALYEEAPWHPHGDLAAWKCTVVFSPHPDDESLGCGGLIALLRERGQEVHVVFVSDGGMSHPGSRKFSREDRVSLRVEEARKACAILGVDNHNVHFLALPDGEVMRQWSPDFPALTEKLAAMLSDWHADTLIVPWRRDVHPDHLATWEICQAAARLAGDDFRWIEFPVWMWEANNPVDLPRPDEMIVWRLDISDQLNRKEAAIQAHATQMHGTIDDDPGGFQLADHMLAYFRRPAEVFFERADKRHYSLSNAYFERVYQDSDDPWNFTSSPYEQDKYAATLAALPRDTYESAFEIGCSIGVLTALLAERCERLLAVDTSELALEKARERLTGHPAEVEFRQMEIPVDFPADSFDLVVLSEVGYYWSYGDLDRAIALIQSSIKAGGTLILVHYTPYVPDYPLTGDEVHETFTKSLMPSFRLLHNERAEKYRIDVWSRSGGRV